MQILAQSDRQATWKEVCEALALSALDAPALGGPCDDVEVGVDFSQRIITFAEEVEWLALAREAQNCSSFN
jgi:hypothetical protein